MNINTPISPGVSAFVARMRVRALQPLGALASTPSADATLAWRVSPASGRLESRRLIVAHAEEPLARSC
ncbi:hypothetical protein [Pseudomonas sp. TCU-HL1]|uniref:hypothetical protein n=1 Tax=Pseudomonas sp. TCU-HL1 TaxID=1856685 RepID=UPI00083CFB9D|nr:hypothetical protein [Pseudomonas sp. TCU-HL1]AOE87669.1 hypothetical protein THL1_5121 [Pseudomonas sp. TCU-HL1]